MKFNFTKKPIPDNAKLLPKEPYQLVFPINHNPLSKSD